MIKDNINILYEDENLLAIDKPAGLVVHADGKTEEQSVCDWLMRNYPAIKEVGEPWTAPDGSVIYRPGIVHRLDRDTSGVLVICKNQETFEVMKLKFQNREVSKMYCSFVYGEMKTNEGVIDRPIARSRKDFRLWSAQRGARGQAREAVTEYRVLARGKGCSYILLEPKTGRTHQLRVHMKAINHPIVNDPLYAPKREPALGLKRLALHALSVSFILPSGKPLMIESPLPEEFKTAQSLLSKEA